MQRRHFIKHSALTSAFLGLSNYTHADSPSRACSPYGPLIPDPKRVLDLPKGFNYQLISRTGQRMSDGFKVPAQPDGMAAFPSENGRISLVCNHELAPIHTWGGPFENNHQFPKDLDPALCYDPGDSDVGPHLGGTTNLIYDPASKKVEKQFLSLTGTDRNCAGGAMPWGTWITCEEAAELTTPRGQRHGYCFEVSSKHDSGLQKPIPLKKLGRFRHEAVALDPETGILYITEDLTDGLFYRFVPDSYTRGEPVDFFKGKLQALSVTDKRNLDIRNYNPAEPQLQEMDPLRVAWLDMEDVESPKDDLRFRGHRLGATRMARGEGIHYSEGSFYICATDGGPRRQGQIFKLTPGRDNQPDILELFLEANASDLLNNGDNLTNTSSGDLIICEDLIREHAAETPHLRGITPDGRIYTLARNAMNKSEFAGSTFSPDGSILFVNIQKPGLTLAITGPWRS